MDYWGEIESIEDVAMVGASVSKHWYRGHARAGWSLTPRVHRPFYRNLIRDTFPPPVEHSLITKFRRRAPAVATEPLPDQDDDIGWLSLMQHHRTPTRLLDWTESALIALYFVVSEFDHQDDEGELWVMDPYGLNAASGYGYALPIPSESKHLEYLAHRPRWDGSAETLLEDLGLVDEEGEPLDPPAGPLAFPPIHNFRRIAAQLSTFTIHPDPDEGTPITELQDPEDFIWRYRVPAGTKEDLRQDLEAMGITARRLFPDLEGLSTELEHGERTFGEPAQKPPKLDE